MQASLHLGGHLQWPVPMVNGTRLAMRCVGTTSTAPDSQPCGRRVMVSRSISTASRHRAHVWPLIVCTAAAELPGAGLAERPKLVPKNWQRILEMHATGEVLESTIEEVNKGGVIIDVNGIKGFIPFTRMDPGRGFGEGLPPVEAPAREISLDQVSLDEPQKTSLIGTHVVAKIIQVDVPNRRLVLSERAAYMSKLVKQLKPGEVVSAVVHKLTDFGAFVNIQDKNGDMHGEALIHKSQLSWDVVMRPEQVVSVGDVVQAAVTHIDKTNARINLSLKRMTEDPLKETLDGVLPAVGEDAEALGTVPINVPQSIEEVVGELQKEEGISEISMGRQVEEKRTVAQDLEIYISKKDVEGGYALVARAGRIVQEINITTALDPAGLKAAMQRALKRLV